MPTTTSRSKTKKVKKPKPIPSNIRQKALSSFQKLRRAEEANADGMVRCISCGKVMDWRESQGGHYIPRGVTATELEPDNVNPQCPRCNGPLNGNYICYRMGLVNKIGEERVQRLEHMMEAYRANYSDCEAMELLSAEDRASMTQTKGKVYYKEKYDSYRKRLKEMNIV